MLTKAVTGEGLFLPGGKKKVCICLKILCEEQRTDPPEVQLC